MTVKKGDCIIESVNKGQGRLHNELYRKLPFFLRSSQSCLLNFSKPNLGF